MTTQTVIAEMNRALADESAYFSLALVRRWRDALVAAPAPAVEREAVAWRFVGTERRPKEPITAYAPGFDTGFPRTVEWEVLYRWEATIAATTTDGKPPAVEPQGERVQGEAWTLDQIEEAWSIAGPRSFDKLRVTLIREFVPHPTPARSGEDWP